MGSGWQVELKTERFAMAFRLLLGCTFFRAESEQNSSQPMRLHPATRSRVYWRGDASDSGRINRVSADTEPTELRLALTSNTAL
jgi:hypothetical protein